MAQAGAQDANRKGQAKKDSDRGTPRPQEEGDRGREPPDSGSIHRSETVVMAFFDQTGGLIDGSVKVLNFIREADERIRLYDGTVLGAERFLERFLFPRTMFSTPLSSLSGGEFHRLHLIRLLATAPIVSSSTNRQAISTSTPSARWNPISSISAAASSWFRMTGRCSKRHRSAHRVRPEGENPGLHRTCGYL
ncbi:MAG: putative ABC transporter ATP-binding protein [Candidatus Methanofastidiosum methylothiophilum]|uniref:Putative ABC transporter ATP-binding protein n=1 Tax=Candidatus Methanofastidiosum methylothiophilum TaxID=1705564 RepID=A0A150J0J2_9EURY|nr:MAG: putative ABC transporter ATP-binding protein [Candidatus Methanofastidiosum methylthiophilus]